jgi:hypothetical protein
LVAPKPDHLIQAGLTAASNGGKYVDQVVQAADGNIETGGERSDGHCLMGVSVQELYKSRDCLLMVPGGVLRGSAGRRRNWDHENRHYDDSKFESGDSEKVAEMNLSISKSF